MSRVRGESSRTPNWHSSKQDKFTKILVREGHALYNRFHQRIKRSSHRMLFATSNGQWVRRCDSEAIATGGNGPWMLRVITLLLGPILFDSRIRSRFMKSLSKRLATCSSREKAELGKRRWPVPRQFDLQTRAKKC